MDAPRPTALSGADHPSATRALILTLAVSGFASTFAGRITEPLVPVIARDLATEVGTVALFSAAYALPYAFVQPVLGALGDGLGKADIIKICLGLLSLTLIASAFAPTSEVLFGLRVLAGLAAGGVVPLALAMIGDRVALELRQVAISRFLIAVILGQLAGSALAGLLAGWIGWRGAFGLAGGIAVLAGAAAFLRLRPRGGPKPAMSLALALTRYRDLVANPRARLLFALVFVEAVAIFGVFPYIAPLLDARDGGGPTEAGLVIGGFALGGLVYTALVGTLLAALGIRRMLAAGGVVCGAALVVIGSGQDWPVEAAAMIGLGLGFYMLHNSFQVQVTEVAPGARASAVALHAFSFFCGQALGVVLVGAGLPALGQEFSFAACTLAILGVGLIAGWRLRPSGT